jgi:PAB1-binding protein PBP1
LRNGTTIDDALLDIYGFDVEGLEAAWREAIGAEPKAVSTQPTAQPTPTFVPTYVPYAGAPLEVTPTPYAVPTSSTSGEPSEPIDNGSSGPPLAITIILMAVCCVVFLLFAVLGLGIYLSAQKRKGENNETDV